MHVAADALREAAALGAISASGRLPRIDQIDAETAKILQIFRGQQRRASWQRQIAAICAPAMLTG